MAPETKVATDIDTTGLSYNGTGSIDTDQAEIDWTREEEKRLVRRYGDVIPRPHLLWHTADTDNSRLDSLILPLLMLAFFALQLDRGNM